jgi:hypothetical protein
MAEQDPVGLTLVDKRIDHGAISIAAAVRCLRLFFFRRITSRLTAKKTRSAVLSVAMLTPYGM